jgi:mannose/fructose/N-acetylgalactosamine-specific phosphotransferase system component IIB
VTLALARVDDRLVHGQVVLVWCPALRATRLLVADDGAASLEWERQLLVASAGDLAVEVFATAETASRLEAEKSRSGAAILLFRSPDAALAAVEAGAAIPELNLGGLHFASGREPVLDYLYLNEADRRALKSLEARGVRLAAQDVPSTRARPSEEWLAGGGGA